KYLKSGEVRIAKGWFKDTVPQIPASTRFALVHIDGDLYESAYDVLDGLLSRGMITDGASLYFDDWDCNTADPMLGERRAWAEMVEKYKIRFSDMGAYGMACHRFIVHSYSRPG